MIPRRGRLVLALAILALARPATAASPAGVRSEIPITETILSDGARRYAVALSVGATPLTAGLDTGSTIEIDHRHPAFRMTTVTDLRVDGSHIYAGLIPYFAFSVLYDPEHRLIGLKPRAEP